MNAFEWDMALAHMTAFWGAEVETRLGDTRTSGMWFHKLERWDFVDIATAIEELAGTHEHMPALSSLRELTIAAARRRHANTPSIAGPNGGAREWELERIEEAKQYAQRYNLEDEWLGRRVAAIRTDGVFSERVKALESGDTTPMAEWWAKTFGPIDAVRGGQPQRIGEIINAARAERAEEE